MVNMTCSEESTVMQRIRYKPPSIAVSVPLCIPLADDKGAFAPRKELLYEVLQYCDLRDQIYLAATNKFNRHIIQDYIDLRKKILALRFFNDSESFYKMLKDWHSIIGGWAALHLLLPAADAQRVSDALEIYIPGAVHGEIRAWLMKQGFDITHMGRRADSNPNSFSQIEQTFLYTNQNLRVVVFASKTDAACAPIFQLQNTACMNFISTDRIFCAYPHLTFRYLCMVNPAPLFCNSFGIVDIDVLQEYETQGFTYLPWSTGGVNSQNTPCCCRRLTDCTSMFIDTTNLPFGRTSSQEILDRYGMIDLHWTLGGKLDDDNFVYPRIEVIENRR